MNGFHWEVANKRSVSLRVPPPYHKKCMFLKDPDLRKFDTQRILCVSVTNGSVIMLSASCTKVKLKFSINPLVNHNTIVPSLSLAVK
jgi:hypothetical protein